MVTGTVQKHIATASQIPFMHEHTKRTIAGSET
jgi:hypothetical protein